ncbi:Lanosterol 14-Alpha Demethylase [Manis pentadactyla]|nr:Lanosterol 14-Alpha Demethylase [Manis pentadactyla]
MPRVDGSISDDADMKGNVKMVEVKCKQKSFKMRRQFKEVISPSKIASKNMNLSGLNVAIFIPSHTDYSIQTNSHKFFASTGLSVCSNNFEGTWHFSEIGFLQSSGSQDEQHQQKLAH